MIYLLLSICCSVTVAVLLKLAKRYHINVLQAVMWNYLSAISLGYLFFQPDLSVLHTAPSPIVIAIGVILPVLFLLLAASVRHIGIVKTDIAQRLSLFIPVLAAFYLFDEHFNQYKIAGLIVGFIAIFLIMLRKSAVKTGAYAYVYPLLVFVGFGVIDVLFKKLALDKSIPYTTSLLVVFAISLTIAACILLYKILLQKEKVQLVNFVCGLVLGGFNFGNILFYMKAHRAMADNPSTVFAAMNMGVILLGTCVGILIFKEKLSKLNYLGIAFALVAILLITLSQQHAV